MFDSLMMSLYERAYGEGGGRKSFVFSKSFAIRAGVTIEIWIFIGG